MITISELSARLDRAITRLDSEIDAQAAKAGADIVALITNRVVQKGEDSDGGQFSPYSTNEVPAFFFFGKSRSGSGENKVKAKAKKREEISYKEFRGLNNLNESPKNFEFTGSMWRGFGVVQIQRTGTGVTITIGGRNTDSENKITWNTEGEGKSIIKPSAAEIGIVETNLQAWVNGLING